MADPKCRYLYTGTERALHAFARVPCRTFSTMHRCTPARAVRPAGRPASRRQRIPARPAESRELLGMTWLQPARASVAPSVPADRRADVLLLPCCGRAHVLGHVRVRAGGAVRALGAGLPDHRRGLRRVDLLLRRMDRVQAGPRAVQLAEGEPLRSFCWGGARAATRVWRSTVRVPMLRHVARRGLLWARRGRLARHCLRCCWFQRLGGTCVVHHRTHDPSTGVVIAAASRGRAFLRSRALLSEHAPSRPADPPPCALSPRSKASFSL
jgi:hypothetical protein